MKYIGALILALTLLFIPQKLTAQMVTDDISIDTIPINPEPGQTVTLTATSYSIDLSQANLTWVYNNTIVAKGVGKTSIAVIAPASGATGVVSVSTTGAGSETVHGSVILRPASVDVIWEASDSYTPPFYKGKALLAPNGKVRVTAVPSLTAPKNLSYTWSRNGSALQNDSGYNKSSVLFTHSEFNPQEFVEVTTKGGVFQGAGSIRVSPQDPSVVIYQNKRGFIDYAHGYSDSIPLTQGGVVLHSEPFYFSLPNKLLSNLEFKTTIDGELVTPSQPNEIGLSRPTTAGKSILTLAITPFAYSLQHIEKTFTLIFN